FCLSDGDDMRYGQRHGRVYRRDVSIEHPTGAGRPDLFAAEGLLQSARQTEVPHPPWRDRLLVEEVFDVPAARPTDEPRLGHVAGVPLSGHALDHAIREHHGRAQAELALPFSAEVCVPFTHSQLAVVHPTNVQILDTRNQTLIEPALISTVKVS